MWPTLWLELWPALLAPDALLLEALTRWDAEIWLSLQAKWDLWQALKNRALRPKVRALPKAG